VLIVSLKQQRENIGIGIVRRGWQRSRANFRCVCRKLRPLDLVRESLNVFLFLNLVSSLFKSKSRLEAENAALRQQLTVLQRKVRGRVQFTNSDRLFFIQLYR